MCRGLSVCSSPLRPPCILGLGGEVVELDVLYSREFILFRAYDTGLASIQLPTWRFGSKALILGFFLLTSLRQALRCSSASLSHWARRGFLSPVGYLLCFLLCAVLLELSVPRSNPVVVVSCPGVLHPDEGRRAQKLLYGQASRICMHSSKCRKKR